MRSVRCRMPTFSAAGETLPPCQIILRGTVVTSAQGTRMSMPSWHISSYIGRLLSTTEQRLMTIGFFESTIRERTASVLTIPMGQRKLFLSPATQITSTDSRGGRSI